MLKLKDMVRDSQSLAGGLRECGTSHVNYKLYTSMERALSTLLSGNLYLSNGKNWNDIYDREAMLAKGSFALCLSYSTRENIAMWMLYGRHHGKEGAMLSFTRQMLLDAMNAETFELGNFNSNGQFETRPEYVLKRSDLSVFLTDVVYSDDCSDGRVKLTHADDHVTVDRSMIDHDEIFHKNIAWQYENECRMVIKPSAEWRAKAIRLNLNVIRVSLPEKHRREMQKSRLVRSPVYVGTSDFGKISSLAGEVSWNLE